MRCTLRSRQQGVHGRSVLSVSWSPTLDLVASCGADNAVQVSAVDRDAMRLSHVGGNAAAHEVDVNCVAWRPGASRGGALDGMLASCGDDGLVKLWAWRG